MIREGSEGTISGSFEGLETTGMAWGIARKGKERR